jgi:hypothetical protein
MRAMLHLPARHRGGGHTDALTPGDELGRRPLTVCAVRRWHVLGQRRVLAPQGAVSVYGHPGIAGHHFHRGGCHPQFDLAANQPVRHAVVVAIELDVVVDVDARALEVGDGHAVDG